MLTVGMLMVIVPADVQAQGCAMCKTALAGVNDPLAQGIFWSVLLLISMPFLVVGSIGGWIFYTYRNTYRHQRPSASVVPFEGAQTKKKEDFSRE